MKHNIRYRIFSVLALMLPFASASFAQETMNSAYFLDGYAYRHDYNPAFVAARSYFSIPALGSVNVSLNSNMGISTFLYPNDGKLTTFMHPSVSTDSFMKRVSSNNNLNVGVSTKLLSIGIWGNKGGFTTVGLDLKANVGLNLPGELFRFMKEPGKAQSYDISGLGVRARSRMELSLGHSRKVGEHLNVGAKVKFLVGLASADVNIDRMNIRMDSDRWSVTAQGSARLSSGRGLVTIDNNESGQLDFDTFRLDPAGAFRSNGVNGVVGGYGAAIDLGATYEILDGLTVSAAVLDLGFLSWNSSLYAETDASSWTFEGFENVTPDTDFNEQFSQIADSFEDMIVMRKIGDKGRTEALAARVNIGLEYKMPFWKGMSVGALYSGKYQGPYSFNEGRLSLNFAFGNVFSLSGSYGLSNFGHSAGAALNLHCRALSFYLATDTLFWNVTAPVVQAGNFGIGLPYRNANVGINFGLVFNVSKRKDKVHKRY